MSVDQLTIEDMLTDTSPTEEHTAVFDYDGTTITMLVNNTGETVFTASPIAKKLAYRDAERMLRHMHDNMKSKRTLPTKHGIQTVSVITFDGLIHALSSRQFDAIKDVAKKNAAKKFVAWANDELIPSIRNHEYTFITDKPAPTERTIFPDRSFSTQFGEYPITAYYEGDSLWFRASDITAILGTRTSDIRSILEQDEVVTVAEPEPQRRGGAPLAVSEPGLYRLVMRSRKPAAKQFQQWITHDVRTLLTIPEEHSLSVKSSDEAHEGISPEYGQVFIFNDLPVTVFACQEELWFLGVQVCAVLGTDSRALRKILDADEINTLINVNSVHVYEADGTPTRLTEVGQWYRGRFPLLVSESGLYSLILRSRKPVAKPFQRWVTHDVLPSIRKHGAYATEATIDKIIADPDFGISLLSALKQERARRENAERAITEQKPKVRFADAVTKSDSCILIRDLAHDLRQNGVDTGQNRLFAWMRDNGWLSCKKGESWNEPTQHALEMGLFRVHTSIVPDGHGSVMTKRTAHVTGKGRVFFMNKLLPTRQLETV